MKRTVQITLPYPPSANRIWRTSKNGRTFLSSDASDYKRDVAKTVKRRMCIGELSATFHFYRPRKAGDLSNRIKLLEDALQGILYENDSQIVEIHAFRLDDKANPRVEVTIQEL